MANNIQELNIVLADAYEALPEPIQDWLSSEECTNFVSEINRKLGLKDEKRRILPQLIIRLVLKDIEPPNFINEIGRALGMNYQAAKALTQEIDQKILGPINVGLRRDVGLDTKLIYLGKPGEEGPAALPVTPAQGPAPAPPAAPRPRPTAPPPPAGESPFLIYKEGQVGRPAPTPPSPPRPPVSGETAQPTRVIHYSDAFTPLDKDVVLDGNTIDLRSNYA